LSFASVRGQDRVVHSLQLALGRGRLAHALIFAGPAGVGKAHTARALAGALLCPEAPGKGCGHCDDCHLVGTGAHPDLLTEDLEQARKEKPTATKLSIEQIRRVRARLAMRAVRGPNKVGIIDQAELLTIDAQNALLKTLEEPPGQATLILVSSNRDALLGTIRSRCQCILFAPLDREEVQGLLLRQGVAPDAAAAAATLSQGSVERALALAEEGFLEHSTEVREKFDALGRASIPDALDLAVDLVGARGEKGRAQRRLNREILLDWCRDQLVRAAQDCPPPGSSEDDDRLAALKQALRRAERAYATTRELDRNANAHLAWDRLLLALRELH